MKSISKKNSNYELKSSVKNKIIIAGNLCKILNGNGNNIEN